MPSRVPSGAATWIGASAAQVAYRGVSGAVQRRRLGDHRGGLQPGRAGGGRRGDRQLQRGDRQRGQGDAGRRVRAAVLVADRRALDRADPGAGAAGQDDQLGVLGAQLGGRGAEPVARPVRRRIRRTTQASAGCLSSVSSAVAGVAVLGPGSGRRPGGPAPSRSGCAGRWCPRRSGAGRPRSPAAPGIGTRPSAWASRPPTVSTSSAGSSTSNSSPRSSTGSRAVTRTAPSSRRSHRRALDVVLVGDLADDLLEDVLDGDQAGGAAVLVDDDRQVGPGGLHLARAGRRPAWTRARRSPARISSATGSSSARRIAALGAPDQVLEVEHAEHVVDALADHRDPGEAGAQEQQQRLLQRLVRLDPHHLGARHHHLAGDRVAEREDRVDHLALAVLDHAALLGQVDQLAQLDLGGERALAEAPARA